MSDRMSPRAIGASPRGKRRFLAPVLTFLFGMAVPVVLAAAGAGQPSAGSFAKIGQDPRFPNALVCQHNGELILLTYQESAAPIKRGLVTFSGTIHAVPLREKLRDYLHAQAQESQEPDLTSSPGALPAAGAWGKSEHK